VTRPSATRTQRAVATVRLFGVIFASSQTGQPAPLRPRQGGRGQSRATGTVPRATGQVLRWSLPPPPAPGIRQFCSGPFMALPCGVWPASSGTLYRRLSHADAGPQGRQREPIMIGANSPAAALQGRAAMQRGGAGKTGSESLAVGTVDYSDADPVQPAALHGVVADLISARRRNACLGVSPSRPPHIMGAS
jgi:hypothetical protein